MKIGEEIEAQYIGVDRKNQFVTLSVKALEIGQEKEAKAKYLKENDTGAATTSFGDILKEQLEQKGEKK